MTHSPETHGSRDDTPEELTGRDDTTQGASNGQRSAHRVRLLADPTAPKVRLRRSLLESLPFGVIAYIVARLVYAGSWNGDWSRPITRGGDASLILMMVKGMQTHGWFLHNANLNAPFGQQFYDFPSAAESIQLFILRIISIFTDNAVQTVNIYYMGGFAALAIVTYLVMRHLRFAALSAGAVALLFTFLPFHFAHNEGHLYRSTYLSAPIAALLIVWALSWRSEFLVDAEAPMQGVRGLWRNLRIWRVLTAAALCVVVAAFETMMLAFFLTVLVVAALLVAIRRHDWGTLSTAAAMVMVCAVTFAVVMVPTLRFWAANGTNPSAARRYPAEQELYGLKPSQMLLPVPDHRIAALRGLQKDARHKRPITSEEGQGLGFLGAIGLLTILGWIVTQGVERDRAGPAWRRRRLLGYAGLSSIIAILFGTISGFALVLSIAGFSQIRVWNRIVVLIAFFAFIPVAIFFDWLLTKGRPRARHMGAIGLVVALTAFGLVDTTGFRTQGGAGTNPPANIAEVKALMSTIEAKLPHGASVFQLPVTKFPEVPPTGTSDLYDQLLPYLYSSPSAGLHWSGGGMKGRPNADWQQRVVKRGITSSLPGLVGLGFDSILIDTHAYSPGHLETTLDELDASLGEPEVVSRNGRWRMWSLSDYAATHDLSPTQLRAAATGLVGAQIDAIQSG